MHIRTGVPNKLTSVDVAVESNWYFNIKGDRQEEGEEEKEKERDRFVSLLELYHTIAFNTESDREVDPL